MTTPESRPRPRVALIVEDQPDALAWLRETVSKTFPAAAVETATTLALARAAWRAVAPDLALIDLGLPDGSGIDLVREMNTDNPEIVTVVTTVFSDDQHLFAALSVGAHGYVLKDESRDHLGAMLEDIVSGKPPLSPAIARRLLGHFRERMSSDVQLTERERDVLTLLAKGLTVARVAEMLGISRNTAAGYAKTVYRKLNVTSRAEATLEAARRGLVRP
jgi:DNA-binding NarL/FixJ family response regulator